MASLFHFTFLFAASLEVPHGFVWFGPSASLGSASLTTAHGNLPLGTRGSGHPGVPSSRSPLAILGTRSLRSRPLLPLAGPSRRGIRDKGKRNPRLK